MPKVVDNPLSRLHLEDAARAWKRRGAAHGSLALLDPDLTPDSAVVAGLGAVGIDVGLYSDDLAALARLGARTPDVAVVSCQMPTADLARLVVVLRAVVGGPVLLAFEDRQADEVGPAVAAGALPVVRQPYRLEDLLRVLEPHWPQRSRQPQRVRVGQLELDLLGYDARMGGAGLDLTRLEFEFVAVLVQRADHVVLRETLTERLWPDARDADGAMVGTATRVRRKLAAAGAPDALRTVRGVGYRIDRSALLLTG
ncbi:MAG: winged helix-turn-helix domain-containing protein [Propionibacterium sp.]|nr:winged helix-turn-helix domain-containing protein [Propionibacterium sp.]